MASRDAQVVVVGGGISGLACAHRLHKAGIDVLLVEASDRVGGKIRTITEDGYQFEAGPNTLIANKPELLQLIRDAGLENEIVDGSPASKRRWISLNGRMCPLPSSPVAALTSPLLGPGAVARVLGDLFMGRGDRGPEDESVASFITRHFGRRVIDNLAAPFLTGVYAGDVDRLEARSVLPMLVSAEAEKGSVIRGLIAAKKAARRAGKPRLPLRTITFRDGLESLPRRLAAGLGDRVMLNAAVSTLDQDGSRVRVNLSDGSTLAAERIVLTSGARVSAGFVRTLPGGAEIAARLERVPQAGLSMVGLAYDRSTIDHPLDGFGYLNGPGSSGPVLGSLFRSSVFPHVAPAGKGLLVAFLGGVRFPGYAERPESELIGLAERELRERVNLRAAPLRTFVCRWPGAVAQYERGHAKLRQRVEEWSRAGRVSVVGAALTGVSLNDCAAAGFAEAERLASALEPGSRTREGELCASV